MIHRRLQFQQQFKGKESSFHKKRKVDGVLIKKKKKSVLFTEGLQNLSRIY